MMAIWIMWITSESITTRQIQRRLDRTLLPMIGAMTIITMFLSPYVITCGWKVTSSLKEKKGELKDRDSSKDSEESESK
jgi:hypothetical protein